METDPDLIKQGVEDAFTNWLLNHEISFPALLEETIGNVFASWLEEHSTEIVAAIVKQYAQLHPKSASQL
jgi:hypothetical protein